MMAAIQDFGHLVHERMESVWAELDVRGRDFELGNLAVVTAVADHNCPPGHLAWSDASINLLDHRIVIKRWDQQVIVKGFRQFREPGESEIEKNPGMHPRPVVNGHNRSSPREHRRTT